MENAVFFTFFSFSFFLLLLAEFHVDRVVFVYSDRDFGLGRVCLCKGKIQIQKSGVLHYHVVDDDPRDRIAHSAVSRTLKIMGNR